MVYCFEVPSHVFMSRLNGKNVWIGNCCFSEDHEVLTENGWTPIKEITTEHKVAALKKDEKTLYYTNPVATQKFKYTGKMYEVNGNGVSFKVTPNHRMYVSYRHKEEFSFMPASLVSGEAIKYKKNIDALDVDITKLPDNFKFDENGNLSKFIIPKKNGTKSYEF